MAEPAPDRILSAIGLRLLSVVLFGVMNVGVKLAQPAGASLPEILFWRQAGAAMLVAAVVASGPGFASLRTQRMRAHVIRCAVGLVAMSLTFAALILLPLAEAITIGFSMPIYATVLSALVLKEATGKWRWGAVAAGFAGVLIVTQPGSTHIPLAGAVCGMTAAFGTATVMILLRSIGKTEKPLTTVWWFSILSTLPLGVLYLFNLKAHPPEVWAMLIGVGLLGGAAQLAMTGSLARGPVSAVVPMDYTALIWATLFGWLVFGTLPVSSTWVGAPLIIASGLVIVWREHVRRREETTRALAQQ